MFQNTSPPLHCWYTSVLKPASKKYFRFGATVRHDCQFPCTSGKLEHMIVVKIRIKLHLKLILESCTSAAKEGERPIVEDASSRGPEGEGEGEVGRKGGEGREEAEEAFVLLRCALLFVLFLCAFALFLSFTLYFTLLCFALCFVCALLWCFRFVLCTLICALFCFALLCALLLYFDFVLCLCFVLFGEWRGGGEGGGGRGGGERVESGLLFFFAPPLLLCFAFLCFAFVFCFCALLGALLGAVLDAVLGAVLCFVFFLGALPCCCALLCVFCFDLLCCVLCFMLCAFVLCYALCCVFCVLCALCCAFLRFAFLCFAFVFCFCAVLGAVLCFVFFLGALLCALCFVLCFDLLCFAVPCFVLLCFCALLCFVLCFLCALCFASVLCAFSSCSVLLLIASLLPSWCTVTTTTFCCTPRACNNLVQELAWIAPIFPTSCNWTPPQPAPEKPVRPAQQGHREPCQHTATGESVWSAEQTEPWGSASASRQGC